MSLVTKKGVFVFSDHALSRMISRGVSEQDVKDAIERPTRTVVGFTVFEVYDKDLKIIINKKSNVIITVFRLKRFDKKSKGPHKKKRKRPIRAKYKRQKMSLWNEEEIKNEQN